MASARILGGDDRLEERLVEVTGNPVPDVHAPLGELHEEGVLGLAGADGLLERTDELAQPAARDVGDGSRALGPEPLPAVVALPAKDERDIAGRRLRADEATELDA